MLNIFVNTWGNYNENGADGGKWITLPMDPEELEEVLENIAALMKDNDPEWAIHDYEWECEMELGDVHEMDSITDWNERCQEADGLEEGEAEEIAAAIEAWGYRGMGLFLRGGPGAAAARLLYILSRPGPGGSGGTYRG